jgi:hypothetical protein
VLSLIANAFPSDVCEGSSSQLVAIPSGGSGTYTYEWSPVTYLDDPYSRTPVSTPAENITYTVTVNDGVNQVISDPVVLTVVPKPTAPVITDNGTQLISDVTTGNQWYLNGGMIPGATEQTYTPVESGIYYATVTDAVSGCQSDPSNTIQFAMVGIDPLTGNDPVLVYPNPFSDRMNVAYSVTGKGQVRLSLTDAFGKELRILASYPSLADGKYTLNFSRENLNAGCYFLKVQTGTYTVVKKIMLIN